MGTHVLDTYVNDGALACLTMNIVVQCLVCMSRVLFASALLTMSAQGAMVIDQFLSTRNDRFANDPDFLLQGHNLSGVARASNGRWATMISPNYFLTATHSRPSINSVLTFHQDNNPTGVRANRTVVSGQQIGITDLWIGRIDSPAPPWVSTYPVAPIDGYSGETVYHVGVSATPKFGTANTTNMAVGRNVYDLFFGLVDVNGRITISSGYANDTILGDLTGENQPGPNLLMPDETFYQGGDSGAPTFILDEGKLVLFGIHSFKAEVSLAPPHTTFERQASGDVYLPFYRQLILASGPGAKSEAIPEPSPVYLVTLCFALFLVKSRARQ